MEKGQVLTFLEDSNAKDELSGCTKKLELKVGATKLFMAALIKVFVVNNRMARGDNCHY
jgi:hypothetical protein